METTVLITGGAGYIGSHVNRYLIEKGYPTVVLDNLSTGHRASVQGGDFVHGDIRDAHLLEGVLSNYPIGAVMHFSALSIVEESVKDPLRYFDNNVAGTIILIRSMLAHGVEHFIFSSTAAVYGEPEKCPIGEDARVQPKNPYGHSKRIVETVLEECSKTYPFSYIALRYFNAAGAEPSGSIGEDHDPETHLIPIIVATQLGQREYVDIYGTDYPTPDGTAIRDYIHVDDLAEAHVLALTGLLNRQAHGVFNIGHERGFSVREVIQAAESVVGKRVPCRAVGRRQGDPAILVANSEKSRRVLGWFPRCSDLETIVQTAWNWHAHNPFGFLDEQGNHGLEGSKGEQ